VSHRRRRRRDRPSWSWVDLRSTLGTTYRLFGYRTPCGLFQTPGVFRRTAGPGPNSRPDASLPWPSPLLQGLTRGHPPSRLPPKRPLRRRASRGVLSPSSTFQVRGSTTAGFPAPASFRPQGFDPLDGLLPAHPGDPVSGRSARGLSPYRGLLPRTRRHPLSGPVTSSTLAARPWRLRRSGSCRRRSTRVPVLEVLRVRDPFPPGGCYADRTGRLPSWASLLPGALPSPAASPRPGDHPPLDFPPVFGLAPRLRCGPPGY